MVLVVVVMVVVEEVVAAFLLLLLLVVAVVIAAFASQLLVNCRVCPVVDMFRIAAQQFAWNMVATTKTNACSSGCAWQDFRAGAFAIAVDTDVPGLCMEHIRAHDFDRSLRSTFGVCLPWAQTCF